MKKLPIKMKREVLLVLLLSELCSCLSTTSSSSAASNQRSSRRSSRSSSLSSDNLSRLDDHTNVFLASHVTRQRLARQTTYDNFMDYDLDIVPNDNNGLITYHQQLNGIKSVDNRKPMFSNCSNYAPSVREEQPPGTPVITVKAIDPDIQDAIDFSFVKAAAERPKFRIDSHTGQITTAHSFDRDEPIREKEVYITVRATDNGRPPLDDVCTFKVIIEDINDNPPVFDKTRYEEPLSEDKRVGEIVTRISASDLDDGDNSIVKYQIRPEKDAAYFKIDENTGIITLARTIDKRPSQSYVITVRAYNLVGNTVGVEQDAQIEVKIPVVESNKRSPQFVNAPSDIIYLDENFEDFGKELVNLTAVSNVVDKPEVIFELVTGRTEQTNNKKTFVFNQTGNSATISLGKRLDYETITDYSLTMRVRNTHDLAAEHVIKIKVRDVNDNIPYFTEVTTGTIPENEPVGTPVMQVRAFDMDGTEANNIISFELGDNTEFFKIDPITGNITALKTFDREERDFYNVKVIATDNSKSSLYTTGQHNVGQQVFRIEIADKNDHAPKFKSDEYIADKLAEDANQNYVVIEVAAYDNDTASQMIYTIVSGNVGDAFRIENTTGLIRVNKTLDYETINEYTLRIRAFDGVYEDFATVTIRIENVNDNPPVFEQKHYNTTIEEETVVPGCILVIKAYDPDIKDRYSDQMIKYSIVKTEQQHLLDIDSEGCLKLKEPLNRDQPDGYKKWQVIVQAADENGNGLRESTDVSITLTDINDNAPFLTNKMPVVWYENQPPGRIVQLTANDYDEPQNGPPFSYEIDANAAPDIQAKFSISGDILSVRVTFDREEQKEYHIPVVVGDSGYPNRMSNVSVLHLVIGDVNDNAMKEGSSNIFVYNYKGESPDVEIGRVYVDDPDDWDLPDKSFSWKDGVNHPNFALNKDNGMITMVYGTSDGEYHLHFTVVEQARDIERHTVDAHVNVTVREIPEEAVVKSGSIRLYGITAEEFITERHHEMSPKEKFRYSMAQLLNVSADNLDVFTVLRSDNDSLILDVRFSAHGSPYYAAEKLNGMTAQNQAKLEEELGLKMLMVNIDECIIERYKCESSCSNVLHTSNVPLAVYTNTTSFVGVNAFTQAECVCHVKERVSCLNGGTAFDNSCECPEGYEGPHCESISIGFYGNGWAMYPPLSPCDTTKISLELTPQREDGLVMYIGPLAFNPLLPVTDFLALELVKGYPTLTVDYGTGSIRIEHKHIHFGPGKSYMIDILLQKTSIEMTVDSCKLSTCMSLGAPQGPNEFLNVNAPLQLGGASVNLEYLASLFNWTHVPQSLGYSGCIKNLTVDEKTYNIGAPSLFKNIDPGCQRSIAVAVSFGIDRNFLIALLCCIALLIILLLAVVVHRRHQDGWHEKDMDDIRETIINYEDEGGGERDTDYDLNVLRAPPIYEDKPYKTDMMRQKEMNEVPDIGAFLTDKKDACDKDTDAYPIDDVRHYAYEGDGNSSVGSSLSSLASCTDDGDLKFNYLSNFGPRFRKLADMYGEEPSDTDSNVDGDEGWRI